MELCATQTQCMHIKRGFTGLGIHKLHVCAWVSVCVCMLKQVLRGPKIITLIQLVLSPPDTQLIDGPAMHSGQISDQFLWNVFVLCCATDKRSHTLITKCQTLPNHR